MHSMRLGWLGAAVSILPMLVGCTDRERNSGAGQVTDQWLGQWNGPEGTFLKLEGAKGEYQVTIQNLDGPRTFSGRAADDEIQFERDGVKEAIRATNGVETGMKWLAGKTDCLTIKAGEGYCRD
jgi:hypothetical protein